MQLKNSSLLKRGEYRIEKVLGQGGFGITYLAEQTSLQRKVAIKEFFMKEHCNREPGAYCVTVPSVGSRGLVEKFRLKFIKEARTIASFSNAHIISIYDVFEENGTAYYVMEYLEGNSLASMVKEQGVMPETLAVKYVTQVAEALAEVHANKLLHLDVKPANIMLNKKGEAVLIDFGISKHYDELGIQTSSAGVGVSEGYAPLEQYEAGALDSFTPATDIYALGATFFFLLTGKRPPKASEVMNYGLPEFPSNVSPSIRNVIVAAMHPAVRMRPQSIEEFLGKLKAASFDNTSSDKSCAVQTSFAPHGSRPASVVKAESFDDDETRVGINPPRPSATPPFEKVGELSKTDSDEETRANSSSVPGGVQTESTKKTNKGKIVTFVIAAVALVGAVVGLVAGGSDDENIPRDDTPEKELVPQKFEDELPVANDTYGNRDFIVDGVEFTMVAIEGGTFQMGSNDGHSNEKPVHDVTLSDYYIGETEVTQELWQAVMGSNPSYFKGDLQRPFKGDLQRPVENVSYNDCRTFVNKLNDLFAGQLPAGREFRLPTEAEWEYAARGGKKSNGYEYSGSNNINIAWYVGNSNYTAHPVKKKKTVNELGLYDMSGNVHEWCFDSYTSYTNRSQTNPKVDNGAGSYRVLRGGGWNSDAEFCRVADRDFNHPDGRYGSIGLRLAL